MRIEPQPLKAQPKGEICAWCSRCAYVDDGATSETRGACMYILHTGHSRMLMGIEPGRGCTARKLRKPEKPEAARPAGNTGESRKEATVCYRVFELREMGIGRERVGKMTGVAESTVEAMEKSPRYAWAREGWERKKRERE